MEDMTRNERNAEALKILTDSGILNADVNLAQMAEAGQRLSALDPDVGVLNAWRLWTKNYVFEGDGDETVEEDGPIIVPGT